jgi:hypothetical protein
MYEKISEAHIREEKIKRLKEKALKEIEKEMELCKRDLIYDLTVEMDAEEFENTIKIVHSLYKLKEYINSEYSFMRYTYKNYNLDIVIYEIPIKNIDIWLQDDCTFITKFMLDNMEDGFVAENVMYDRYFSYDYIGIIESIEYDEKLKKEKYK